MSGLLNVALLKAKCQDLGAVRASVTHAHSNIYFEKDTPTAVALAGAGSSGKLTVLNKDNLSILKMDNNGSDTSKIWQQTFAILDNLLQKYQVK